MELDLLKRRAEKIPGGEAGEGTGDRLSNEFRLLTEESFNCSGIITGLLLVGDVRVKRNNRNKYAEIQIWRNAGGNTYTRQARQDIKLNAGDFSPDGVFQYNLTSALSFQSGDVLGVYQPDQDDSIVRVYYDLSRSTTYQVSENNPTSVNISDKPSSSDKRILISPISGIH